MTLYCILIYDTNYKITNRNYKLDDFSFIYRSKIKETIETITNELIRNIKTNSHYKITENNKYINMNIYCNTYNGFHIIITDLTYPETTSLNLLNDLLNDLKKTDANYEKIFNFYQNPTEPYKADKAYKVYKIKSELNDVKEILMDDINKLLERGDSIEDLMIRTAKLEETSKFYVHETEKLNDCCCIL